MNQSVEFDESNHVLMQKVAEQIALVIPEVFPPYLDLRDRTKNNADKESEQEIRLSIQLAHQVSISEIRPYLDLLITNLGSMYEAIDGPDWTKDKIYEMAEPGLIYVAYKKYDTIVAYISVKLVKEYDAKKLYLYEIHVDPEYQGQSLGKKLMHYLDQLCTTLQSQPEPLACTGISLTVFAANQRAYQMYQNLGFHLTENSPTNKMLRNKIIAPTYYLMTKP